MSTAAPKVAKLADPFEGVKKAWKRTGSLRKVLAGAFIIHGTIRLGTDFWNLRQPFILSDMLEWWRWLQVRWAELRGVKVRVDS